MTTYYLKSQFRQFISSTGIVLTLVLGVTMLNSMNSTLLMKSEVAASSKAKSETKTAKLVKADVKKPIKKASETVSISVYN